MFSKEELKFIKLLGLLRNKKIQFILKELNERPKYVKELYGQDKPIIKQCVCSGFLKVLLDHKMVTFEKRGRHVFYSLNRINYIIIMNTVKSKAKMLFVSLSERIVNFDID
jgi:hypothetical protein